jgi:hypothetical protein
LASALGLRFLAAEQLLVEFADLFHSGFQLTVIGQAAPHGSNFIWRKADVSNDGAGIANGEHGDRMPFTASALGTAGAMADGALEQGAAEDVRRVGETIEEAVALADDLLVIHQ